MSITVLIVDDSHFFQHRLTEMLNEHPDLKVVGVASNGREAVEKAKSLNPDVITMDYEMPVMDGVTAVRQIMAHKPVPILMFSSLTYEGAKTTLDALEAGAVDFIPKNFAEISKGSEALKKKLHNRLLSICNKRSVFVVKSSAEPQSNTVTGNNKAEDKGSVVKADSVSGKNFDSKAFEKPKRADTSHIRSNIAAKDVSLKGRVKLLAIGASTGGPVALTEILKSLPSEFPVPIVLTQHMPENFTKAFSDRLNRQCKISVKEAEDGDQLLPGRALLAPGGKQMLIDRRGSIKILPGDDRTNYKPSVDITFGSAANAYGSEVLAIILTGMGADGCEGARLLKQRGSFVWSQDEQSCVIYGMPMTVAKAQLTDKVIALSDVAPQLIKALMS
jgi:two-component system chemotaxis response regulator CheB